MIPTAVDVDRVPTTRPDDRPRAMRSLGLVGGRSTGVETERMWEGHVRLGWGGVGLVEVEVEVNGSWPLALGARPEQASVITRHRAATRSRR